MYKNMRPADWTSYEPHPREPLSSSGPVDVTALEEQLAAQHQRYLRLAADFENFKKRTARKAHTPSGEDESVHPRRPGARRCASASAPADPFRPAVSVAADTNRSDGGIK